VALEQAVAAPLCTSAKRRSAQRSSRGATGSDFSGAMTTLLWDSALFCLINRGRESVVVRSKGERSGAMSALSAEADVFHSKPEPGAIDPPPPPAPPNRMVYRWIPLSKTPSSDLLFYFGIWRNGPMANATLMTFWFRQTSGLGLDHRGPAKLLEFGFSLSNATGAAAAQAILDALYGSNRTDELPCFGFQCLSYFC